ncbi:MAG: hypothetical protein IPN06_08515 [Burkholderiales bacterium]|nr:hypothetical protein [Burkholderiales bacterium]
MAETPSRWLSVVHPAPEGFSAVTLSKRHLLNGPVALLVPTLAQVESVLPDFRQRFVGVIITPGQPTSPPACTPCRATRGMPPWRPSWTMCRAC